MLRKQSDLLNKVETSSARFNPIPKANSNTKSNQQNEAMFLRCPQRVVHLKRETIEVKRPQGTICGQIQPALGMSVRCADGTRCSPFASALFVSGVLQRHKPVRVQAFVPKAAVEH
jgi:hypothetical protein